MFDRMNWLTRWFHQTGHHVAHGLLVLSLMFIGAGALPGHSPELLDMASANAAALPEHGLTGVEVQRELERSLIRDLMRAHRRGADPRWLDQIATAIHEEASGAGIDPLLVASIVANESSFRPRAVSHMGAVGLMQLRPFVARDVADRSAIEWRGLETLYEPQLNVRLGARYFGELVERFDGDPHLALTAYNYGPTHVSNQVSLGAYAGSGYASRVLDLYSRLSARRGQLAAGALPARPTAAPGATTTI